MLEKGSQPNISCQTLSFRNNDLYSDTGGSEYELPFFISSSQFISEFNDRVTRNSGFPHSRCIFSSVKEPQLLQTNLIGWWQNIHTDLISSLQPQALQLLSGIWIVDNCFGLFWDFVAYIYNP